MSQTRLPIGGIVKMIQYAWPKHEAIGKFAVPAKTFYPKSSLARLASLVGPLANATK
jgi:hypothetical protein